MESPAPDLKLNQMLERAADGKPEAWRTLVEAYSGRVFGLLVRQCGDRDLAEEITQATFVQVVSHIGRYREQGKFEPWLFRIAMNKLRDELRRRKRQARSMDMSGGGGSGEEASPWSAMENMVADQDKPEGQGPLEQVAKAEQVQLLRRAVADMSEADQRILYLRHTAGLSFAQIAEALDEPLGTVLARGHRALAKLRKLLGADTIGAPGE
jgi:RNA polymerase sigma-70 factor, ECF subfamily